MLLLANGGQGYAYSKINDTRRTRSFEVCKNNAVAHAGYMKDC